MAGISTAWLYGNEALQQRIMHLRLQQVPAAQIKIPRREQASSTSKDTMIAALRQRIKKYEVVLKAIKPITGVSLRLTTTEMVDQAYWIDPISSLLKRYGVTPIDPLLVLHSAHCVSRSPWRTGSPSASDGD